MTKIKYRITFDIEKSFDGPIDAEMSNRVIREQERIYDSIHRHFDKTDPTTPLLRFSIKFWKAGKRKKKAQ